MLEAQSLRSCRPWLGLALVAALAACSSDAPQEQQASEAAATETDDQAAPAGDAEADASDARSANRPSSPDGYRLINQDEARWVLASRMLDRLSDENLAEVFVDGYSSRLDAFAKKDLIDRELPKVKQTLADWAKVQDFRMEAVSNKELDAARDTDRPATLVLPGSPIVNEFDVAKGVFTATIPFGPCQRSGTQNIYEAAGATYSFRAWGTPDIPACQITPHSEDQARAIEAARAANTLNTHSLVYFRFPGETKNGAFLMDVHRVDLTFSAVRFDRSVAKYVVEPLGPTITLTEPRP